MDEGETVGKTQSPTTNTKSSMMRRTETTQSKTTISKPATKTNGSEPEAEDDARERKEQGEEDNRDLQPDSLDQDEGAIVEEIHEAAAPPEENQEENSGHQSAEEKKPDQAYHEPDTLEREIGKMMDAEETVGKTQCLKRGDKTALSKKSIRRKTTRTKTGAGVEKKRLHRKRRPRTRRLQVPPTGQPWAITRRNDDADSNRKLPANRGTKRKKETQKNNTVDRNEPEY